MADVNVKITVDDEAALIKLEQMKQRANAAEKSLLNLERAGHSMGNIQGYQKSIAAVEKLNKLLNQTDEITKKTSSTMEKFATGLAGKLTGVAVAMAAINKTINLIKEGFTFGKDYLENSYNKALEINKEKAGLKSEYLENNKNADKMIISMDKLADQLLFLGIDIKDTFKAAKLYEMIFPKSNEAASHNFVAAAGLIAAAKFHGNMEQASSSLLQVESGIALGRFGIRLLKAIGLNEEQAQKLVAEIKAERKNKGVKEPRSYDDKINELEGHLIKYMAPIAQAQAMADPLSYFKAQLEKISITIGQSLIKAFQTKGVQDLLDTLVDKLKKFAEGLTAEKITGTIEAVINFGTRLSDALLAIVEYIEDKLPKSSAQIKRENDYFTQLTSGNKSVEQDVLRNAWKAYLKSLITNPSIAVASAAVLGFVPQLKPEEAMQNVITKMQKGEPGSTKQEQNMIDWLKTSWRLGKFDVGPSAVPKPPTPEEEKNAKRGLGSNNPFNIANETSAVTGNKATTININIQDQIKELTINSNTLDEALDQIEDKVIECLNDALMSAESVAGN